MYIQFEIFTENNKFLVVKVVNNYGSSLPIKKQNKTKKTQTPNPKPQKTNKQTKKTPKNKA